MTNTIPNVPRELKPCPFCGGEPNLTTADYVHDDLTPMPVVECKSCSAWVQADDWNTRAPSLSDHVEDVRAMVADPSPAGCETCHDQGEIWTGQDAYQGHLQPPEPIMEVCPECSGESVSPAGVEGLEVVGVLCISRFRNNPAMENVEFQITADVEQGQHDLCRLSDAQAIIDGLRGEVEQNVRARMNQFETLIKLQDERDQLSQRVGELEGLLNDPEYPPKHSRRLIAELREECERVRQANIEGAAWVGSARLEIDALCQQRDHLAQCLKFARTTMAVVANNANLRGVEYRSLVTEVKHIDAALSAGKEGE